MQQWEIERQREIEYRLDEIEGLEDCGITRSAKVQKEYERLMTQWKRLQAKAVKEGR